MELKSLLKAFGDNFSTMSIFFLLEGNHGGF